MAPVVVPADMPEAAQKSAGYLTNSEKIAIAALEEAVIEGGEKPASSRIPEGVRAVTITLWRDYAYKRGITDADTPEARKKAFQRARQALLAKKRIGTWGDHVWLAGARPSVAGSIASSGTRDIDGTIKGHVPEH
jgi:hypothetical protein